MDILVTAVKGIGYATLIVLGYYIMRNIMLIKQHREGLIPQGCDAVAYIPYQWIANAVSCSIFFVAVAPYY